MKLWNRLGTVVVGALVAGWVQPAVASNMFQNPSFEAPGGFLTSWGTIGGPLSSSSNAHTGAVAVATGGGEVTQTVSLVLGQSYEFSMWALTTNLSFNTLRVQVGFTTVLFIQNTVTGTYTQFVSAPFTATAVSNSVRILANSTTGSTTTFDDVCLDVAGGVCGGVAGAGVPEPAVGFTMAAGLVLLGVYRRFGRFWD